MATAARPNEQSRIIVFAVALVRCDLNWMNLSTEGESARQCCQTYSDW